MNLESLLVEIEKFYDSLYTYYLEFKQDPEKFEEYVHTELMWNTGDFIDETIRSFPFERSLVFLKNKCREYINRVDTTVFLYESGSLSNVSKEFYEQDYLPLIDKEQVIILERGIDKRLTNQSININEPLPTISKPGRKSNKSKTADLNHLQAAKLYKAIASAGGFPNKDNQSLAKDFVTIVGWSQHNSRIYLSETEPLSNEDKEKIASILKKALSILKDM